MSPLYVQDRQWSTDLCENSTFGKYPVNPWSMVKLYFSLVLSIFLFHGCHKAEPNASNKGLVLYLPFNNELRDESGLSHTVEITRGAAAFTMNRYYDASSALRVNYGQYLEVPDFDLGKLKSFTFYIEFLPTITSYQSLFSQRVYSVPEGVKYNSSFNFAINYEGQVRAQFRRPGECMTESQTGFHPELNSGSEIIQEDSWNYAACSFDGKVQRLYLNGKLVAEQNIGSTVFCGSEPLRIGSWWQGDPQLFDGSVDEVRVYDRALTDKEIFGLFRLNGK